jgi:hypothetical protein
MEMGQLAKKLGWKEKWMDSRSFATADTYRWREKVPDKFRI